MRAGLILAMLATAGHAQTAPTGVPRNLTVAPPGASDLALAEADVPSGRFSGPWQTGALDGFRFRRFPDATASVGADLQMGEWRIDIACAPQTGACEYTPHGTPPDDAAQVARRLGGWLVRLPPPPAPPEPTEAAEPEPLPPEPPAEEVAEPEPAAVPAPPPEPEAPPPEPQPAAVAPIAPPPELDAAPAAPAGTEASGPTPPMASAPPPASIATPAPAPRAVATTGPTLLPPVAPQPLPPRSATPRAPAVAAQVPEPGCACICDLLPDGVPMARLQALLAQAGHDPGPIDGSVGPRTRAAAREAFGPQVDIFAAAASLDLLERLLCSDPQ